jgi:uncharacterized phage protein (TIGR02220 family)
MAKDKTSFILYADQRSYFDKLTDEEAGRLIKHIFSYVNDENPNPVDRITDLSFEPIKLQLKRDLIKYESIVNRNKSNGSLGGRPKTQEEPKKPTGLFGNPTKPKKADNDNDNDNVNVNVNDTDIDSSKLLSVYNSILGKTARVVNTKTKTQIKDRLKEGYTKEDIVNAIRNASKDPHHIEFNYKYLTLEFITRPDKLDRFVNMGDFKIKTQIL